MKPQIHTNWESHVFAIRIGDNEYEVEASVFVREMPSGTDFTLEGWKSEPECLPGNPDYTELDEAVMSEVEEKYQ